VDVSSEPSNALERFDWPLFGGGACGAVAKYTLVGTPLRAKAEGRGRKQFSVTQERWMVFSCRSGRDIVRQKAKFASVFIATGLSSPCAKNILVACYQKF
jgi:hypothetical protein